MWPFCQLEGRQFAWLRAWSFVRSFVRQRLLSHNVYPKFSPGWISQLQSFSWPSLEVGAVFFRFALLMFTYFCHFLPT